MTNRGRPSSSPQPVRYLDLSFEGRQRAKSAVSNNGFRPHGGHRVFPLFGRGTKAYPPSTHSFNKPSEYHNELQDDIDALYTTQRIEQHGSPAWVAQVAREPNHSGESPLFQHQLLASSRVEQNFPLQFNKAQLHQKKPRAASATYYRPNSAHRYLSATAVHDDNEADMERKLGRPTRTTLLRARQRCNSAPVNAYDMRRDLAKRNEQRAELKKNLMNNLSSSMKDLLDMQTPEGETMHSFLVGARYNRANYVDAKTLTEFGVYMPRNSPQTCFLAKQPAKETARKEPENPPVSPAESMGSPSSSEHSITPSPPASPPQPGQAWIDPSAIQVRAGGGDRRHSNGSTDGDRKMIRYSMSKIFSDLIIDQTLDLLSIGYRGARPRSSRTLRQPPPGAQHSAAHSSKGLPSVYIQGTSIPRPGQRRTDSNSSQPVRCVTSVIVSSSQAPPPSPTLGKSQLTVKDISKRLDLEALYEARPSICGNAVAESPDIREGQVAVPPSPANSDSPGRSRPLSSMALDRGAGDETMSMSSDGAEGDVLMDGHQRDMVLEDAGKDGTEVASLDGDAEDPSVASASGYFQAAVMSCPRPPESIMKSNSSVESEHKPRKANKVRFDLPTNTSEPNVSGGDKKSAFFITEDQVDSNCPEGPDLQNKHHISVPAADYEYPTDQFAGDPAAPDSKRNIFNPFQKAPASPEYHGVVHSHDEPKDIDTESVESEDSTPYITGVDIKPKASPENVNLVDS